MPIYSLRTCEGWITERASVGLDFGDCAQARLGAVILFFIIAMIRKWVAEPMDLPFNFLAAEVGGILAYILVVTFTGSFKIALLVGLVAGCAAGYFGSMFLGSSEGGIE